MILSEWCFRPSCFIKVKVHIYSPAIPNSSADFTQVTPWYGNSLYYGLISRRRMQLFAAANAVHTLSVFRSTRYPLLLGSQRKCGFKSCQRGVPHLHRAGSIMVTKATYFDISSFANIARQTTINWIQP
jgi:hypothetical protein